MFTRGARAALLVLASLWLAMAGTATAKPAAVGAPPVLDVASIEINFATSAQPPAKGWIRHALPVDNEALAREFPKVAPDAFWARMTFDRNPLGAQPLVLMMEHTSERFVIYLNGVDVYRNFSGPETVMFAWNRPWLVPLPQSLLKPTGNEILIHLDSSTHWAVRVGRVRVGADSVLRPAYSRSFTAWNLGPRVINLTLLFFTLGAAGCWWMRPQEPGIRWLVAVGALWWFRNLHYYIDAPPFDPALFWALTVNALFVLMIALYGFAAEFMDIPYRRLVITVFSVAGIAIIILRAFTLTTPFGDALSFVLTVPMALGLVGVLAHACWRKPSGDRIAMLVAVTLSTVFSFHDLVLMSGDAQGLGFYLQPYSSLIVFSVFAGSLLRRMLAAMGQVEVLNQSLELRVADASRRLMESEEARRRLEVVAAVEIERERLMREIHDGVGSSLITALSLAESHKVSPETIRVLRRALSDLKIAVDSLEPIEGDVVALIASLRHRMEPDLARLGVSFGWLVEETDSLPWLDAVGALHVLRILQEAVSNTLMHGSAQTISVRCANRVQNGVEGVVVEVADDGIGFDQETPRRGGRGLENMRSRAGSIGGALEINSAPGKGVMIRLWLPRERSTEASPLPAIDHV
jgi:signal transduction histidine kinase